MGTKSGEVMSFGVLLDLDQTLVDTSPLKPLRDRRQWSKIQSEVHKTLVLEGAHELLAQLRAEGMPFGVVTSAPRRYAEQVIHHHELEVQVLTAYHDTRTHKPAPAPLHHGLSVLNVSTGVYVGDAEIDRLSAEAAGLAFIGVPPAGHASLGVVMTQIRELRRNVRPMI
jgi:HAD superfamily hydrolase (TIGR01549 family)